MATSGGLNYGQYAVLIIVSTVFSILSIIGSSAVIFKSRRRLDQLYHRLLFALSIGDVLSSAGNIFKHYTIPKGHLPYLRWASGTTLSCSVAGFLFFVLPYFVAAMNTALSIHFLLRVRYNTPEHVISKRYEKWAYIGAILIPLVLGCAGLATESFNVTPIADACTLGTVPSSCLHEDTECERGSWVTYHLILAAAVVLLMYTAVSILCTAAVYLTVRSQTLKMQRYSIFRPSFSQHLSIESATRGPRRASGSEIDTSYHRTPRSLRRANSRDSVTSNHQTLRAMFRRSSNDSEDSNHHQQQQQQVEEREGTSQFFTSGVSFLPNNNERRNNIGVSGSGIGGVDERAHKLLRELSIQSVLYSAIYLNTLIWIIALGIIRDSVADPMQVSGTWWAYIMQLLGWVFFPSQGLFNCLVYMRPTVATWKEAEPDLPLITIWRKALSGDVPRRSLQRGRMIRTRSSNALNNTTRLEAGPSSAFKASLPPVSLASRLTTAMEESGKTSNQHRIFRGNTDEGDGDDGNDNRDDEQSRHDAEDPVMEQTN